MRFYSTKFVAKKQKKKKKKETPTSCWQTAGHTIKKAAAINQQGV
jgi:hypothetical protein